MNLSSALIVKDLRVDLPGINLQHSHHPIQANRILVDNVSFSLAQGEVLGVLGQSGSGKSLTALAIAGLLPKTMLTKGSVTLDGQEIIGSDERTLNSIRGTVDVVFQEPAAALDPLMKIGRQIALPVRKHSGLSGKKLKDAVFSLLGEVKLDDVERVASSYPHEISGGQRQRVAIALALACSPKLLIADEPTSAIDAHIQKQLAELIVEAAERRNMAVIFISHDIALVRRIASRVIVMKGGHIVEEASADELYSRPRHEYTKLLIASERRLGACFNGEQHEG
jgi:peptide/nickel transport system ATP-binding protein